MGESELVLGVGREIGEGGLMLDLRLAWNSGQSSCFILPGPRVAGVSHHAQSFWNLCPGIQTLNFGRRRRDQMAWGGAGAHGTGSEQARGYSPAFAQSGRSSSSRPGSSSRGDQARGVC